jgi:hypothetical protein
MTPSPIGRSARMAVELILDGVAARLGSAQHEPSADEEASAALEPSAALEWAAAQEPAAAKGGINTTEIGARTR